MIKKRRIHIEEKEATKMLNSAIYKQINQLNYHSPKKLLILCIGTDRSTGDSLGPLTGTFLKKEKYLPAKVIGSLNKPVHASNLDDIICDIHKNFTKPFIIAVDAGLGKQNSIGYIDVKKGALKPGTGVNKNLSEIGDMHITGLVNVGGYMEYLVLQSTRLSLVMNMAKTISKALKNTIIQLQTKTLNKNKGGI